MKVLVVLALVVVASAFEHAEEWETWKKTYGKKYESEVEELQRMLIWNTNRYQVEQHNSNVQLYGFTTATNEYSDLDSAEFSRMVNGYRYFEKKRDNRHMFVPSVPVGDLTDTVDWRTKGYVTSVKNQGQCGSCWAFSATGSVEGQHFRATGKLVSLSEQNLMDCSRPEGDDSCEGGLMDDAFEYIIKNGGIDNETSYRYQAHDERCRYNASNSAATISSFTDVTPYSEADLKVAVATVGPISVAIDASHSSFQLYSGGVYYSSLCSQKSLDHGVLIVGYGTEDGKDYWLVKNSWGASWGMNGYIKMSRNRNNNCGIATDASYPVV